MQVLVNLDHGITGGEKLQADVRTTVEGALTRFAPLLSRVEVHLGDENGARGGPDDKRCTMEARLEKHGPVAVTHHASNVQDAVQGAADRLQETLATMLPKARA